MISVTNLHKSFRVFDRSPGLAGAFKDLFKRNYRILSAVDGISFELKAGEMVGLIGPNGAGKSTTVKMLTGILAPSSGQIIVNGFDPFLQRASYVHGIGVVFGQRSQLWWDLAVLESLRLLKRIYGVSDADFEERLAVFKRVLDLEAYLKTPVRKLSLGQRMRCDLAASLIHNPRVLFLDEPTIGLDLIAKEEIRKFLKEINNRYQTTLILTTHDLADIEELCERVMVIDQGKLIFSDTLDNLRHNMGGETQIIVRMGKSLELVPTKLPDKQVSAALLDAHTLQLSFSAQHVSNTQVMRWAFESLDVREVKIQEPEIEDVIRKIYKGQRA